MRLRPVLLAVVAVLATGPAQARAAGDPIMPLSEVRAGMECTGYSVFQGKTVEPFAVTILDVVGPGSVDSLSPRILFRVHGAEIERTGIARGFSGSPIYCPGADGVPRVAGAASAGVGDYGDLTALATPIEAVIGTPVLPALGTDPKELRRASARHAKALRRTYPLGSPLFVGGVSAPILKRLQAAGARKGVELLQAPGPSTTAASFTGFKPGSAVGTSFTSGELSLGGIGTVSYVDGNSVWAFGHELEGVGRRSVFLQDASISTIIVNPTAPLSEGSSYKLGAPTADVGTLSSDGIDAVAGTVGALPPSIPVHIEVTDTDTGKTQPTDFRAADETAVGNNSGVSGLAFGAPTAILQAVTRVLGAAPARTSGDMCFQIRLKERKAPLRFCNRYVDDGLASTVDGSLTTSAGALAATDAQLALSLLDAYAGKQPTVTGVQATLHVTRGQRMAYLRGVRLPRVVRRGRTVRGAFDVRVVRGAAKRIPFRWRVPTTLERGKRLLKFRGPGPSGSSDGLFDDIVVDLSGGEDDAPVETGPRTLKGLAHAVHAIEGDDGVRLRGPVKAKVLRDPDYRIGGSVETRVRVR